MAGKETVTPKRGEIYLVNFDPIIGSEIKKTRPALIVQNNIANRHSPVTIVAAITSQYEGDIYPTEILVRKQESGLPKDSVILLNQIRTIDKQRLIKHLGQVKEETMRQVDRALKISLALIEI